MEMISGITMWLTSIAALGLALGAIKIDESADDGAAYTNVGYKRLPGHSITKLELTHRLHSMAKRLKALNDQRVRHWRGRYKVDYGMLKIGLGKRPAMNALKEETHNISDKIPGETKGVTDIGTMPHSSAILKAINELYDEKRQHIGSHTKWGAINRSLRGRIDPVMYWLGIG